ncbi:hypothetical protein PV11_09057 [Exophiala sideris]|uniref:Uncharacterized protein n=1 Tax=Exophiala sideris TaxID=1016849 RepID=A0A0D1Y2V9_9EURO|nr:hypothetical protein PV11_09057 [Exophiala sideris]
MEYDSDDIAAAAKNREREREIIVCKKLDCRCEDPATKHPHWPWSISRKALDMVAQFRIEVLLREAEAWDSMQYGDHSGYGFQEVVDNHLVMFNKEFQKKHPSPAALWPIIEAFAFNLPDDRAYWFHIDDGEGLLETLKLLGVAVFSTLRILEEHDLLRADSPVKNVALVLAYLRRNMEDWPGNCTPEFPIDDELAWCDAAIVEAQHKGIEFKLAPWGIETKLKKDGVGKSRYSDYIKTITAWKQLKWDKEYKTYYNKHRTGSTLGGRQYVVAPQPQAKRLRENAKVAPWYLA